MKNPKIYWILFTVICPIFLGLAPGTQAPALVTKNQNGQEIKLDSLKGHPVVLYFYPKDETPGCTKQACSLRDSYSKFQKLGAVIFGVSRQNAESHKKFKNHHSLPFDLLSDEKGEIAKMFEVSTMPIIGLHKRQTVIIGPDGKIVKFFTDVNPETHSDEVLGVLETLSSTARPSSD